MPNSIIPFQPTQSDYIENQRQFINYCKNTIKSIADDGQWEPIDWKIKDLPRGRRKISFLTGKFTHSKLLPTNKPLSPDFIDLAKSIIVYHKVYMGRSHAVTCQLFNPLRFLELQLITEFGNAKISNLTNDFLINLVQKVKKHYKGKNTAYQFNVGMKSIFSILYKNALISKSISWPSHLIQQINTPVGTQGAAYNQSKIADEEDLFNLAKIFSLMFEPGSLGFNGKSKKNNYSDIDAFITNVFVLLLAGPRRIGEVLSLPVDCLGNGMSSDGSECKTIKFYCEKGAGYLEQPIISSLVPQVEEAVKRATLASEQARWLAEWLEKYPDKFPRHSNCPDVDEDKPLSDEEITKALGSLPYKSILQRFIFSPRENDRIKEIEVKTGYDYNIINYNLRLFRGVKKELEKISVNDILSLAKDLNITPKSTDIEKLASRLKLSFSTVLYILQKKFFKDKIRARIISTAKVVYSTPLAPPYISLRTLNKHIHSKLPTYFPRIYQNIPTQYKNGLFCRLAFQGSTHKQTQMRLQPLIESLAWDTHVNGVKRRGLEATIWQRFNIKRKDEKKPHLNTHSIRHYLDNIAAKSGLSQLERAWWAGRNTPSHNDVYDHRTDEDFLVQSKKMELIKTNRYNMETDLVLDKISRQLPVTPEEVDLAKANALNTPLGYCARSINQLPCQIANDCINCTKSFCIKGDSKQKEQFLFEQIQLTEMRLNKAYDAEDDGLSGASRFVIHQQKTLERLRQMAVLQHKPEVSDGSILQIPQEDSSPMALALKKLLKRNTLEQEQTTIEQRTNLLSKRKKK